MVRSLVICTFVLAAWLGTAAQTVPVSSDQPAPTPIRSVLVSRNSAICRADGVPLSGKPAPMLDGFTGDQRFFMGWAQVWRSLMRDARLRTQVMSDPHSPPKFRVNGVVRNMDAWYAAFDVKPTDQLYLAPPERVKIW